MSKHLVLLLSVSLAACSSIQQDIDAGLLDLQEAEATDAVAATLFNSPPVPLPDGGAGPTVVGAAVFFGSRPAGATTTAPTGIAGAKVTVTDTAGVSVACMDQGNGEYTATSLTLDAGVLRYDPSSTYTFTVVSGGTTYTASGSATQAETVPAFEQWTAFDAGVDAGIELPIFTTQAANSPYTVVRAVPPGGAKLNVAFVAVNALTEGTPSANPTWSNVPQTPLALLELLVDDSSFRTAAVTIPGSAFPTPGLYLVSLTAVQEGNQISSNLFLGSTVLIGAASAGILQAQ